MLLGLQKHPSSRGMYGCLRAVAAIPVLLGVSRHFGDNTDDFARFAPFPIPLRVYYLCLHPLRGGGRTRLCDSRTKEGWYLFLVVLSQHVRKTGNPIRSLDLKLSCDIKVVPHGTRSRPDIDTKLVQLYDCQVELHNSCSHADSAQPRKRTLETRPWSHVRARTRSIFC